MTDENDRGLKPSDQNIAKAIHYPDCWDTVAYPTLSSALWELIDWGDHFSDNKTCMECGKPIGVLN